MFRIFSLVITVLSILIIFILVLGYNALPTHQETITFESQYRLDTVWQELLNIQEIPNRKQDVESVDILEEYGKLVAWKENLRHGGYRIYRMNKRIEQKKLVFELTDSSYSLTGIWTFELEPDGNITWITISEESKITDIIRRGYRVIIGRDYDLNVWQKYIKKGLMNSLLITP